jgi:hypothetical protein
MTLMLPELLKLSSYFYEMLIVITLERHSHGACGCIDPEEMVYKIYILLLLEDGPMQLGNLTFWIYMH